MAFSYAYDSVAQLQPRILGLPNAAAITNGYDTMARLLNTTLQNSGGTALDAYTYGYDVGNERTNVIRTLGDYVNTPMTASGS